MCHVSSMWTGWQNIELQPHQEVTNQEAETSIGLWQNLDAQDKRRVVFGPWFQNWLLSGHYRTPKTPTRTPGVESTTRCVLGASIAPAQWPDCCHLRETHSRWSLILEDYHKVRQLVLGNGLVMIGTSLQLVEVNQNSLIQWFQKRPQYQQVTVLVQGIDLPHLLPEAQEPLQYAKRLQTGLELPMQPHQYKQPDSTIGQARQRPKSTKQPPSDPQHYQHLEPHCRWC